MGGTLEAKSFRVEEKRRDGNRLLDEYASFHSNTHFSIQGTRLMTTNSRVKRAIC